MTLTVDDLDPEATLLTSCNLSYWHTWPRWPCSPVAICHTDHTWPWPWGNLAHLLPSAILTLHDLDLAHLLPSATPTIRDLHPEVTLTLRWPCSPSATPTHWPRDEINPEVTLLTYLHLPDTPGVTLTQRWTWPWRPWSWILLDPEVTWTMRWPWCDMDLEITLTRMWPWHWGEPDHEVTLTSRWTWPIGESVPEVNLTTSEQWHWVTSTHLRKPAMWTCWPWSDLDPEWPELTCGNLPRGYVDAGITE